MLSRSTRSPLLALLGASGALVLVACSAADTSSMPIVRRTSAGNGGSTTGSGSPTTGSPSGGSSTNNGDTNSGSSSGGQAPSSSGSTPTGGGTGSSSGGAPSGSSSGSSSGGSSEVDAGSTAAAPSFDLLVDNAAPTVKLADTQMIQLTVAPSNGWTGDVALSLEGAPADVTATLDSATVSLGAAASTIKLTLKSASSSAPVATPFSIVGTAGEVTHKVAVNLTVKPEITIDIPVNVDALKPGFGTINITSPADIATNPVVVHFLNLDSTPHEIHASNASQGFPHGGGTFAQNQTDPKMRAITATGTFKFYLHDEGSALNPGSIVIK